MSLRQLFEIPAQLNRLEKLLSALDDAIQDLTTQLNQGFTALHSAVDDLKTQIANLTDENTSAVQDAADRVAAVASEVHQSFAAFSQDPATPVDPTPDAPGQ